MLETGREILFRGKRKDNGKWVEGYYQQRYDAFENIQHLIFWAKSYTVWEYAEVDHETVCQYTEFSDCNKTKVFEGDILKGKGKLYIVEFDSSCGAFTIRSNAKGSLRCFFGKTESQYMEAVGNMYDNPELLNQ